MLKAYFNSQQFSEARITFNTCSRMTGTGPFSFKFTGKVRILEDAAASVHSFETTVNDISVSRFTEDDNNAFVDEWGRYILPLSGMFEFIILRRNEEDTISPKVN